MAASSAAAAFDTYFSTPWHSINDTYFSTPWPIDAVPVVHGRRQLGMYMYVFGRGPANNSFLNFDSQLSSISLHIHSARFVRIIVIGQNCTLYPAVWQDAF